MLRWKTIEAKCHFYHILTRVPAISGTCVDTNLDHLSYVGFVRILHCKVTLLFHLPDCSLWKEVICTAILKERGIMVPFFEGAMSTLPYYLGFFCVGDLYRKVFTDIFHFIHRHRAIRFSILVLLLVHGFSTLGI